MLEANLQRLTRIFNSETSIKLQQLRHAVDSDRKDYESYLAQYNNIAEQREMQSASARIVSPASLPRSPSSNRVKFYALGGGAGLGGGLLLAFLLEYFKPGVKTELGDRAILRSTSRGLCSFSVATEDPRRFLLSILGQSGQSTSLAIKRGGAFNAGPASAFERQFKSHFNYLSAPWRRQIDCRDVARCFLRQLRQENDSARLRFAPALDFGSAPGSAPTRPLRVPLRHGQTHGCNHPRPCNEDQLHPRRIHEAERGRLADVSGDVGSHRRVAKRFRLCHHRYSPFASGRGCTRPRDRSQTRFWSSSNGAVRHAPPSTKLSGFWGRRRTASPASSSIRSISMSCRGMAAISTGSTLTTHEARLMR